MFEVHIECISRSPFRITSEKAVASTDFPEDVLAIGTQAYGVRRNELRVPVPITV